MKRLRWQIIIVFLALIAIGLLLYGQQPEILPEIEQVEVQPSQGGLYVEALIGSLGRLNPIFDWYNNADHDVNSLIYNSLIQFDDRMLPYGDLADSFGISPDGKTYNFLIRDAIWHDGKPVTSDDVVFTANLLKEDAIPIPDDLRNFWKKVSIEALDEKVVQFRLPESFAPFFDYLTFGILPKHIWEGVPPEEMVNSPLNLEPIGSGPYKFKEFLLEDGKIVGVGLEANTEYFKPSPFIDRFTFKYFPDVNAALTAYESSAKDENRAPEERIQGISQIETSALYQAFEQEGLNIYTGIMPRLGTVLFNLNNQEVPALNDLAVRQALYLGLNRQRIIDQILMGQGVLANGPIFPSSWAYYEKLPQISYNPEKAVSILKDAGYSIPADGGSVRVNDNIRLEFDLVFPDVFPYPEIAKSISEDWSLLGVKTNLLPVPENEFIPEYLTKRNFQVALVELSGMRFPDPDPYTFWHQTQITRGQNYSGWDDRQASEYLEQARTQIDPQTRQALYQNFQIRFMSQLPSLPLFYPVYSYGVSDQIQGVRMGPIFEYANRLDFVPEWFIFTSTNSAVNETEDSGQP